MFLLFILFFFVCGTIMVAGPIYNIIMQNICTQKVRAQYDLYIDKRKPERASLRRGISHVGIIELVLGFGCYGVIWITMFLLFIEMIES